LEEEIGGCKDALKKLIANPIIKFHGFHRS